MVDSDRSRHPDAFNPMRQGLYVCLSSLESENPELPRLGEALRPQQEPVRVGQWPFMNFAVRELAKTSTEPEAHLNSEPNTQPATPRMYFQNFGLLGPQGALPLHLTEYALNRVQHSKDSTFTEFLNVFHHRMYLLFYRAWANAQPHIGWRRGDLNPYSRSAADLAGHGAEAFGGQMQLKDSSRIGGAAHLTRASRPREGLERWLAGVLGLDVRAFDFVGQWLDLSVGDTWCLGRGQQQLGQSILLGRRCLEVHTTVQIEYGPMSFKRYLELMPGERQRRMLDEAVASHLGLECEWQHYLLLKAEEVPACKLAKQGAALGRTAWLGRWGNSGTRHTGKWSVAPVVVPPARVRWTGKQPQCSI